MRVRVGRKKKRYSRGVPISTRYRDRIYVNYGSRWAFPDGNDERAMSKTEISLNCTTTEETTTPEGRGIRQTFEYDWKVFITIWSRNGDQLADELTCPKLGKFFNEEATVAEVLPSRAYLPTPFTTLYEKPLSMSYQRLCNTWATVRVSLYDPLKVDKEFLRKYHHYKNGSIRHREVEAEDETEAKDIAIDLDGMEAGHVESSLATHLEHLEPSSDLKDEPGPGLGKLVEEHLGLHLYEREITAGQKIILICLAPELWRLV